MTIADLRRSSRQSIRSKLAGSAPATTTPAAGSARLGSNCSGGSGSEKGRSRSAAMTQPVGDLNPCTVEKVRGGRPESTITPADGTYENSMACHDRDSAVVRLLPEAGRGPADCRLYEKPDK